MRVLTQSNIYYDYDLIKQQFMAEDNKPVVENKTPATHSVTKPNAKYTPIEEFRLNLEGEFIKTVTQYYMGQNEEAIRFKTAVVDYVRKNPKLLECNRISLLSAFAQVAQFRFMPSGVSGEAYVIPYGAEAKFQLGYQGIITLLYRSGKVSTITANIIYENDTFDYTEGLNANLVHRPVMFGKEKGEAIGVYTVVQMSDGSKSFKVLDKSSVMAIKELSKAKNSKESPWNSDKDPELHMWKKTCLIQHSKLLPKTEELQKATEKDYEGEGIEKTTLDAEGIATAKAFHN